jgi:uncharacterized membrane protein YoaK (UPF0700 family)
MHCENVADVYKKDKMILWLLSAFKAGFINSAGFLITGKFVSHVTGFGTQAGIAMGHSDYFFGGELILVPTFFIFGGVVTSIVLETSARKNNRPAYHYIQGLITSLILLILLIGETGLVSTTEQFDVDNRYQFMEFIVIALLCFVCGLKNSLVTWTTFGKIRVTHLTGLSTDIGLHLLGTILPKYKNVRLKEAREVNIHRIFTLLFFSTGAFLSALVFPLMGFKAFYIALAISLFMTIMSLISKKSEVISGSKAMGKVT